MALNWYSVATMEIWEAMDFGGGLGEVELLYPAKKLGANKCERTGRLGANYFKVEDGDE